MKRTSSSKRNQKRRKARKNQSNALSSYNEEAFLEAIRANGYIKDTEKFKKTEIERFNQNKKVERIQMKLKDLAAEMSKQNIQEADLEHLIEKIDVALFESGDPSTLFKTKRGKEEEKEDKKKPPKVKVIHKKEFLAGMEPILMLIRAKNKFMKALRARMEAKEAAKEEMVEEVKLDGIEANSTIFYRKN